MDTKSETTKRIEEIAKEIAEYQTKKVLEVYPYDKDESEEKEWEELDEKEQILWRHLATHLHQEVQKAVEKYAHETVPKINDKWRKRLHQEVIRGQIEGVGWAYADCCVTLDNGGDPRKTDMADILQRAKSDLERQINRIKL